MTIKRGMALFSLFLSIKREISPLHHKKKQPKAFLYQWTPTSSSESSRLMYICFWIKLFWNITNTNSKSPLPMLQGHFLLGRERILKIIWMRKQINSTKIKLNMKGQSGHSHSTCFCIEKLRRGQWKKCKVLFFKLECKVIRTLAMHKMLQKTCKMCA